MLNIERSQAIASQIVISLDRCYSNSVSALMLLDDNRLVYTEGYIVADGEIIEHGWLTTPNGDIIDVSRWQSPPTGYYPASHYTLDTVKTRPVGASLPIESSPNCNPDWLQAMKNAIWSII
jgi:hypothetical protein